MSPRIACVRVSTIATALRPPRATNSVAPSGARASAVGATPFCFKPKGSRGIVETTRWVPVSTTDSESELALATKSRCRGSSQTIAVGCSPTASVSVTVSRSRSTRVSVPVEAMPRSSTTTRSAVGARPVGAVMSPSVGQRPPQLLTQAVRPSRLTTAPNGATPPVLTTPDTLPVSASTTASALSNTSGTTARPPLPLRASAGAPPRWRPRSAASGTNAEPSLRHNCTAPPSRLLTTLGGTAIATNGLRRAGSNTRPCKAGAPASLTCWRTRFCIQSRRNRSAPPLFARVSTQTSSSVAPNVRPNTFPSNTLCTPAGVMPWRVVMTPGSGTARTGCGVPCENRTAADTERPTALPRMLPVMTLTIRDRMLPSIRTSTGRPAASSAARRWWK